MKESAGLIAVENIVGCIKIKDDPRRRLVIRTHKDIDKKVVGLFTIKRNLLVAAFTGCANGGQFKSIERAFACKRLTLITRPCTVSAGWIIPMAVRVRASDSAS